MVWILTLGLVWKLEVWSGSVIGFGFGPSLRLEGCGLVYCIKVWIVLIGLLEVLAINVVVCVFSW